MNQILHHPFTQPGLDPFHHDFNPPTSTPHFTIFPPSTHIGVHHLSSISWKDCCSTSLPYNNSDKSISQHFESGQPGSKNHLVKPWPPLKQTKQAVIILVMAYMSVAIIGFISNLLVVVVILCLPTMRSVTNILLVNLALADILVCIFVLPITLLDNIYTEWEFGPVVCKLFPYLQGISINGSVNTLGVIAIERYLAVFYSNDIKLKQKTAYVTIAIIWMVPTILFIPWIVVYQEKVHNISGYSYVGCHADWSSDVLNRFYTLAVVFLACYLLPLVCIAIFYVCIGIKVSRRKIPGTNGSKACQNLARSKRRILRMLIVVSTFFALSWLPFYSISVFFLFASASHEVKTLMKDYIKPFAQWLAASNSCVNPFIYCYFNAYFRKSIITLMIRMKNVMVGGPSEDSKPRRPTNIDLRESNFVTR